MPYWKAFRKPEKPKRQIDWDLVWENTKAVLCGILAFAIIGGVIAGIVLLIVSDTEEDRRNASVTAGTVVDMGAYVPGKVTKQYGYWLNVDGGDYVATWDVSDEYYSRVQIGDWVEKGVLPDAAKAD